MKQAITRFLFYLFFVIVATGIFRSSWPDAAPSDPLAAKFAFYFIYYGIGWGFWALIFLAIHESVRFFRRRKVETQPTKELPVPNTQPLERK